MCGNGQCIFKNIVKSIVSTSRRFARFGVSVASNEIQNQLLAALPPNVFNALRPRLVHVELEVRTLVYAPEDEVEWVYFPSSGMISILQPTADSRGIELATVGKEGV